MLRTRNNTDGNKLVIFSGIASYYGDNYIILQPLIDVASFPGSPLAPRGEPGNEAIIDAGGTFAVADLGFSKGGGGGGVGFQCALQYLAERNKARPL